jgi:hypothetical protein
MERRTAIKNALMLLGGTMFMPDVVRAWESPTIINQSFLVTMADEILIDELADVIIPTTDTPGAKAAGVGPFLVKFVVDCVPAKEQELFRQGLADFEKSARGMTGKSFSEASTEEKIRLVTALEAKSMKDDKKLNEDSFYYMFKRLTFMAYFTSEIGCSQALRYEPIPGRYDGAYPYKKGEKAFY